MSFLFHSRHGCQICSSCPVTCSQLTFALHDVYRVLTSESHSVNWSSLTDKTGPYTVIYCRYTHCDVVNLTAHAVYCMHVMGSSSLKLSVCIHLWLRVGVCRGLIHLFPLKHQVKSRIGRFESVWWCEGSGEGCVTPHYWPDVRGQVRWSGVRTRWPLCFISVSLFLFRAASPLYT